MATQRSPASSKRSQPVQPPRFLPCPASRWVPGHPPAGLRVFQGQKCFLVTCSYCRMRAFLPEWQADWGLTAPQAGDEGLYAF